jgi:hypothetical protein
MPVITGPNSQDPKLLGIEEYIRKGLITPKKGAEEKEEQGEKEPASDGAKTPGEGEPATKGKRQSGW